MSLDDIVSVSITAETATPSAEGFGTPLIAAYHTLWGTTTGERVRSYSTLGAMVADGFATDTPAYKIAAVLFAQSPRVPRVKVGRRANAHTQTVRITPAAPAVGEVYSVEVDGELASYTADATPTLAEVCTGLAAAINALASAAAASGASGTYVDVTRAAGLTSAIAPVTRHNLAVADLTADPGIAADLAAINLYDSDWYGLLLGYNSEAITNAAAAWAEANGKLLGAQSADTECYNPASTTDVAADLKAANYARTTPWFHPGIATPASYLAAGMFGDRLPDDPGSDTWVFKTPAGVSSYTLTDTQKAALHAKNMGTFTVIAGLAVSEGGKVAAGEWIDVVRFVDWLKARMRERLFGLLVRARKLPYTDAGIDVVVGEVRAQLNEGVRVGGLDGAAPIVVTAPTAAEVSANDRNARHLPAVAFSARLAGAIHSLTISGTVGG